MAEAPTNAVTEPTPLCGLDTDEVAQRRERYGQNTITAGTRVNVWTLLVRQFASPLILVLLAAAMISGIIAKFPQHGETSVDALLIALIVLLSGVAGFIQEFKSEQVLEELRKMAAPYARVIRDGNEQVIPAAELVPGDVVPLEAGDSIPADLTILKADEFQVNEALLTGESAAVQKHTHDEAYMGTLAVSGNALGRIERIGMKSALGAIAEKLETIGDDPTPFHREIAQFTRRSLKAILGILVIFGIISLMKYSLIDALLIAISLAVAAIPEGLPAVLTLVMTIGAKEMAKRHALLRRLSAIESIGAINTIATDKTGTLTTNEMTVQTIAIDEKVINAEEVREDDVRRVMVAATLCNDARLGKDAEGNQTYLGDQMEAAILSYAERFTTIHPERIRKEFIRVQKKPFTSERMMMSVVVRDSSKNNRFMLFAKGAPEKILERCSHFLHDGKSVRFTKKRREEVLAQSSQLAGQGLRMLGFAEKTLKNPDANEEERLLWIGLIGIIDPPRPEVREALEETQSAGIRVVMITGDGKGTASAIARMVGLKTTGALEGSEVEERSDDRMREALDQGTNIFARVSPFQKIRILKFLQERGNVAMTGDGVNDALALKKADVGVAMGKHGTAVAHEASDMILLDDNFVTIKTAIHEGRRIYENIQKFINYLLTSNVAEIAVLFIASLTFPFSEPILLPAHLLWINLLTDGMPAIALGLDPARKDIMQSPPRKKNGTLLSRKLWWLVGIIGTKKTLVLLGTFLVTLPYGFDTARTTLFTGFILYEFVRIGAIRSQEKLGWFSNLWLLGALALSVILQLILLYTPLGAFFHLVPIGLFPWAVLTTGIVVGYASALIITRSLNRRFPENA